MNAQEIIQTILDIVFTDFMLYLSPVFFVFMVILFGDRIIDLLYGIFSERRRWR